MRVIHLYEVGLLFCSCIVHRILLFIFSEGKEKYICFGYTVQLQYSREKSRSLSSTFWHIREKQGFHFLIRKLGNSSGWLVPPMKFIGWVNLIILFHLAPSRSLWDKYFSCYEFLKIYLRKMQIEFLSKCQCQVKYPNALRLCNDSSYRVMCSMHWRFLEMWLFFIYLKTMQCDLFDVSWLSQ